MATNNYVGPARRRLCKCKQRTCQLNAQYRKEMEENSDDQSYFPEEVEDERATLFGGYEESNGENDNSQSKIEEFIKAQQADNTVKKIGAT